MPCAPQIIEVLDLTRNPLSTTFLIPGAISMSLYSQASSKLCVKEFMDFCVQ
jgi:hypothetical protein